MPYNKAVKSARKKRVPDSLNARHLPRRYREEVISPTISSVRDVLNQKFNGKPCLNND